MLWQAYLVRCTRYLGILFSGFCEDVSDVAVVEGKLPPIRPHRREQVSRVDQQDRSRELISKTESNTSESEFVPETSAD